MPIRYAEDGTAYLVDDDGSRVGPGALANYGMTSKTVTPGVIAAEEQRFQNSPLGFQQRGYMPLPQGWDDWSGVDWSVMSGGDGTRFGNMADYYKWLYGGGNVEDMGEAGTYFKTPNGVSSYMPGRTPLNYQPQDSKLGQLTKAGILSLFAMGLGGALSGGELAAGEAGVNAGGLDGAFGDSANFLSSGGGAATGGAAGGGSLGADASWWSNIGDIGMGDPLTAAGVGGGATGVPGATSLTGGSGFGLGKLSFKDYFDLARAGGNLFAPDANAGAGGASMTQSNAALQGIGENRAAFDEMVKLLAPYVGAGEDALESQMDLMGLTGEDRQRVAIAAIQGSPQYASTVDRGENLMRQNASATGNLRGGNLMSSLAKFRPSVLNSMVNDEIARLSEMTKLGQSSAAGQANGGLQIGSNIAKLLEQQGAALAGGTIANGMNGRSRFGNLLSTSGVVAGAF